MAALAPERPTCFWPGCKVPLTERQALVLQLMRQGGCGSARIYPDDPHYQLALAKKPNRPPRRPAPAKRWESE